jgi:hypothetical protein
MRWREKSVGKKRGTVLGRLAADPRLVRLAKGGVFDEE